MQKQTDMELAMLTAHREFMNGLEKALEMLEKDIAEAGEMSHICTDEWCQATESVIDELHKSIYSISEPRWLSSEDSQKIRDLRQRVKNLYAQYKAAA